MMIGIVGAPNKGKSRFFSALTAIDVQVADYPFTTIEPNKGVALLRVPCAHVKLGLKKCGARGGHCKNGMREVPIQLLDVAGLVPDAHIGKGRGNQFLDDLRMADGFIQVIDASGKTDLEGLRCENMPIEEEIGFLKAEMEAWLLQSVMKNYPKFKHRGLAEMHAALSGLGYSQAQIAKAAGDCRLECIRITWSEEELKKFTHALYSGGKPMVVAANKSDIDGARERALKAAKKMEEEAAGMGGGALKIIPCSAAYEYALTKAGAAGFCTYKQGDKDFEISEKCDAKQRIALEMMREFVRENGGAGAYEALSELVFGKLGMMVVYPVEDENAYCNNLGAVLPDAFLVPKGSTVLEMAAWVHTDLAKNFIGAVDARTKKKVSKEHLLQDGDIIKIIAGR